MMDSEFKLSEAIEQALELFKRVLKESNYETKPKSLTLNEIKLWIFKVERKKKK